jgi:hypothetical protein
MQKVLVLITQRSSGGRTRLRARKTAQQKNGPAKREAVFVPEQR